MKSKIISKPGAALEVRVIPQSDGHRRQIEHSLNHGPAAAYLKCDAASTITQDDMTVEQALRKLRKNPAQVD